MRSKVGVTVMLALVAGLLIGTVESATGHRLWPMGLMLLLCGIGLVLLGRYWIAQPLVSLAEQVERLARLHRAGALQRLPLRRRDEIGRLARMMHEVYVTAIRDAGEVRRLRRNLDQRVADQTQRATVQLQRLAMRDPLTDLGNRRFLDENLEPLMSSLRQSGDDLICVMVDLDNFKQVNDRLGHAAGDELLVFLASLLRACSRKEDLALRLGGDEFAVLMPGADPDRSVGFARQVRALFRQHVHTAMPIDPRPDLSIGLASRIRDRCHTGPALMAAADANLYAAKRAGKGRIVGE